MNKTIQDFIVGKYIKKKKKSKKSEARENGTALRSKEKKIKQIQAV